MTTVTCTTNGITVSVLSRYEAEHSNPGYNKYVHSYTITIENKSNTTVQLISRHWIIMDSHLNVREVRGEGVVGEQPILMPGGTHTYSSWSPLSTPLGKMTGSFQMIRTIDNEKFDVRVPVFLLVNSALFN
jgi:ApaG protein